jgi:hypothetical protein
VSLARRIDAAVKTSATQLSQKELSYSRETSRSAPIVGLQDRQWIEASKPIFIENSPQQFI